MCEARSVFQFPGAVVCLRLIRSVCVEHVCERQGDPDGSGLDLWVRLVSGHQRTSAAQGSSISQCLAVFPGRPTRCCLGAWPTAPGDSSQPRAPALSQPAPHTCCRGGPGAASGCLHAALLEAGCPRGFSFLPARTHYCNSLSVE